ncbi:MAG: SDR family NAD(P)-dependent oxidoreductase [Gammaproteobacteria bacterium]|nr:SDR family NAD(P)-dependent oxidoreductase [Gammaproteobacteria bacterium]
MADGKEFDGRTIVVTGAGGGIGLEVSRSLSALGARVTMLDLKPAPAAAEAPENSSYRQGDVSDPAFMDEVFGEIAASTGTLQGLVNAAGVLWFDRDRSLLDMDLEVWDRVFEINLKAIVHAVRRAVPLMCRAGGGAMVHISSTQALRGDDRPQDAYQASKAALIALSKSLAVQLAGEGIRSNVLLPGPTDSPMQSRWKTRPELKKQVESVIPLGRVGTPRDMAEAVAFLLSDRASYITGTELLVDGGLLARP